MEHGRGRTKLDLARVESDLQIRNYRKNAFTADAFHNKALPVGVPNCLRGGLRQARIVMAPSAAPYFRMALSICNKESDADVGICKELTSFRKLFCRVVIYGSN